MSDEDLRVLARLAETDGGAAVLRYAQALERAGRRSEALAALSRGRAHPDVLAEIRRRAGPATGSGIGAPWSAGPAITRTPVVRWRRKIALPQPAGPFPLHANPFGLVAIFATYDEAATNWICLLDPDTGELRAEPPSFVAESVDLAVVEDTAIVKLSGSEDRTKIRLVCYSLVSGRLLWEEAGSRGSLGQTLAARFAGSGDVAVVPVYRPRVAFQRSPTTARRLVDTETGRVVWSTDRGIMNAHDGPDFVFLQEGPGDMKADGARPLVVVTPGGETSRLPLRAFEIYSFLGIAGQTIYCWHIRLNGPERRLVALDTDLGVRWELTGDDQFSAPDSALAMPSRLVCVGGSHEDREILCLEEPPGLPTGG